MKKHLLLLLLPLLFGIACSKSPAENKQSADQSATDTISKPAAPKFKYEIREDLKKHFTHATSGKTEEVRPNHVAKDRNGTYCYFYIRGKRAISLKLHIQHSQYSADLFELEIGGETKEYVANQTHTTQQGGMYAESNTFLWYDKLINEEDERFLKQLENITAATLRLKSKSSEQVIATIQLTKEECQSLANTIAYYKSLDGAKIPKKGMVNIRGI